jgi:hypothetical protein
MRWSGEEIVAQKARSFSGSFAGDKQWRQLRVFVECHRIPVKNSQISA